MRKLWRAIFIMMFLVGAGNFPALAGEEDVYRVGVGDILDISVLGHDDLKTSDIVGPDGIITFPYIDTIKVEGLTLKEISSRLTEVLSPNYIKFPEVIVRLQEPRSQKFYVYGEVKNPGVYRLDKHMTVLKAISMAGGYSAFANKKVIKILRPKTGEPGYEGIPVNLEQVVNDPNSFSDTFIKNEDIVVVIEK